MQQLANEINIERGNFDVAYTQDWNKVQGEFNSKMEPVNEKLAQGKSVVDAETAVVDGTRATIDRFKFGDQRKPIFCKGSPLKLKGARSRLYQSRIFTSKYAFVCVYL